MIKKLILIIILFGLSASTTWACLSGVISLKNFDSFEKSIATLVARKNMTLGAPREEPQKAYMWDDREGHTTISLEPPKDPSMPHETIVLSRDIEHYSSRKIVDSFSTDVPPPKPQENKKNNPKQKSSCPYK